MYISLYTQFYFMPTPQSERITASYADYLSS